MRTAPSATATQPVPLTTPDPTRVARTDTSSLVALWTPTAVALAMTGIYLWGHVTWLDETRFVEDDPLTGLGIVLLVVLGCIVVSVTATLAVIGTCFTKVTTRSGLAIAAALVPLAVGAWALYAFSGPSVETGDVTSEYGATAASLSFVAGTGLSVVPLVVVVAVLARRRRDV